MGLFKEIRYLSNSGTKLAIDSKPVAKHSQSVSNSFHGVRSESHNGVKINPIISQQSINTSVNTSISPLVSR